jgi:hypothetical protein
MLGLTIASLSAYSISGDSNSLVNSECSKLAGSKGGGSFERSNLSMKTVKVLGCK